MSRFANVTMAILVSAAAMPSRGAERRISLDDFRDKMEGAWLGQAIGVAYGAPTEFKFTGRIVPDCKLPEWTPEMLVEPGAGMFRQDDLYVEMTFLDTLDRKGIDVSPREAGIDFANSRYRLWCANFRGRNNIRRGIAAPWSGHPAFHPTGYDIDYQIEADYSGIIAPGLPNRVVKLGETFGAIMNYGDGVYAGQFIGALYAEAYFSDDRAAVVEKALEAIPGKSEHANMVRMVLADWRKDAVDWENSWRRVSDRYYYGRDKEAPLTKFVSFSGIDARLNGACVLIGYLWGDGDFDKTLKISTKCGYDSDCNPSSACGILGVQLGAKGIPAKYTKALDLKTKFEYTDYDWPALIAVSERLALRMVESEGGRVEKDTDGKEWLVVADAPVVPSAFRTAEDPEPLPDDIRLTDGEMARIDFAPAAWGGQSESRKQAK